MLRQESLYPDGVNDHKVPFGRLQSGTATVHGPRQPDTVVGMVTATEQVFQIHQPGNGALPRGAATDPDPAPYIQAGPLPK